MSKSYIKMQAFAMKSRPDILIVQGEAVCGHENARESREEQNLGEKMGSGNARNIKQMNTCSKDGVDPGLIWGLMRVFWRSGGEFIDWL
jgi:hypothetical protein